MGPAISARIQPVSKGLIVKRRNTLTLVGALLAAATGLVAITAFAQQPTGGTLARIAASRQINVAVSGDSPPFSYIENDRQPAGYSIDLCRQVIAHLNRVIGGAEPKVNWLVGTAAERVQMVASGKADLDCANTTATQTRMKVVDFSGLIFLEAGGFLVVSPGSIDRMNDLNGMRVGVIRGTTTETRLNALLKERGITARVVLLNDGTEGIVMLESGSLDAFASDKIKLVTLAAQGKNPGKLALLAEDLSYEPLAFAVPRGDSNFRLEVNRALTRVYTSGEIESIFRRWFSAFGRPSGLLAAVFLLYAVPE
jgi:ABC-type amino acid transport substrate-binding protein